MVSACSVEPQTHKTTLPTTNTRPTISKPKITNLKLWKPGQSQLGINLYWSDMSNLVTNQQINQQANTVMKYIVSLGANSIDISFPFYNPGGLSGSSVSAGPETPTASQLTIVIEIAHRYGLRVTIRPLMDEFNLKPGWRGVINPTSINQWFASYSKFLYPYIKVANRTNVATFIIGAELNSIQNEPQWSSLIQQIRIQYKYKGEIGYSDNFNKFDEANFGPSVNSLGLDAYFPVNLPASASVDQLASSWEAYINPMANRINLSKIVLSEVGIAAQSGAYSAPFNQSLGNNVALNPLVQENWFTAACNIFQAYKMEGIYFWAIDLNQNPFGPNPNSWGPMSFIGRGDQSIKQCFKH